MDAVRRFPGVEPVIIALHGFTQHGGMFEELAAAIPWGVVAPDLPGHGFASDSRADFASTVQDVARLVGHRPLLGYSQGGRIALGVALEYPQAVSHLILVSAAVGIRDVDERRARVEADAELAARIERDGLELFLDRWLASPLFEGLGRRGSGWCARDKALRLENTADGLAWALHGIGQGAQPYFGGRLRELRMPVLVIVGATDVPYGEIGTRIASDAPRAELVRIEGAGHPVIGEDPETVAAAVRRFLGG